VEPQRITSLYVENPSRDPEEDYFCDGMTEEMIAPHTILQLCFQDSG